MRLIVCIISRATAVGIATFSLPPNISQAAKQRIGRIRFPPAINEYFIDSMIFSTLGLVAVRDSSRAFSTIVFFDSR